MPPARAGRLRMRCSRGSGVRSAACGRRGSFSERGGARGRTGRRRRDGGGGRRRLRRRRTAGPCPRSGGRDLRCCGTGRSRARSAPRRRGNCALGFGHRSRCVECGNVQHGAQLQKARITSHECRGIRVEDGSRCSAQHGPVVRSGGRRGDIRQRLPGLDRHLRRSRGGSRRSAEGVLRRRRRCCRRRGHRSRGSRCGAGGRRANEASAGERKRERDGPAAHRTCCHEGVTRVQARLEMAFGIDQDSLRQLKKASRQSDAFGVLCVVTAQFT